MQKEELFKILNDNPTFQVDVAKNVVDEIDIGPSDIFAATGRVHTGSYRVLNASGDLEEMINFLPKIMKGKR